MFNINAFENKEYKGIRYSRFIASWLKVNGCKQYFYEWLKSLEIYGEKLPEDVVEEIYAFSRQFVGKMELETDIRKFLRRKNGNES